MWLGLAHFHNGYSFLMIFPNLLDIWPVFFLILSRYGTVHFFIVIRLQLMAILCWAAKNSLRGTIPYPTRLVKTYVENNINWRDI
jgi:hypothetical protein